jgi:hypothetical protein
MPERTGRDESLHGLFKDFADAVADSGLPSGLLSPELLQRLMQSNRALLQRYQSVLAQHSGDESLAQQHQELVKAAMLCWLDMGKAFRTYRESVVSAQSALVGRCLELMDPPPQAPDEPKKT